MKKLANSAVVASSATSDGEDKDQQQHQGQEQKLQRVEERQNGKCKDLKILLQVILLEHILIFFQAYIMVE